MSQEKAKHGDVGLVRSLGLFDITMIGVGAMIGAGIFVLTGIAAGVAGPALILAFALNGVITVLTAMVYAELGSAIPEAGGGYLWVKEGLPGPNGFLSGWMSWFAHAVAGSLYGVGFGGFVYELIRILFGDGGEGGVFLAQPINLPFGSELTEAVLVQKLFAALVILLFLYINYRGTSEAGMAGNIVTVLKIIIISIFIISGLFVIFGNPVNFDKFDNFAPEGIIGIVSAMGLTYIAFEGYEIIVQAGEEVRNPRKNIPRAVFLSLAIVIPIYMLVAFVVIGAVQAPQGIPIYQWLGELKEIGIARAAAQFMPFGTFLIMVGGLLSTMSALNATTFSSTRVSYAMGRDKSLPDGFAKVSTKTHTPDVALRWTGLLILFVALTLPIEAVAASADIMFLLLFLQVNLAVITIRSKYGKELNYGYLMPFFPIVPIIAIVAQLLLAISLFNLSPVAWGFAIVWMAVGFLLYYVYAKPRQQKATRTPILQHAELTRPEEDAPYRVLVPIANPDSLKTLIQPAIRAAKMNKGKITLLYIVTVPVPTPLTLAYEYVDSGEELREKAVAMVRDADVPVEFVIRVARTVADAIIDTVREKRADLLLMGWRGRSTQENTMLGHNIDKVINEISCELMMLQPDGKPAQRILIPIANPHQIPFALQAAQLYAASDDTALDILHVLPPNTPTADKDAAVRSLQRRVDGVRLERGSVNIVIRESADRRSPIIEASQDYDLLLLGATHDTWLKRRFFGNTPIAIAKETTTPVILLRPGGSRIEFGMRQTLNYLRGGYSEVQPESRQRSLSKAFWIKTKKQLSPKVLNRPLTKLCY
ncbi:MAG: amino acid permease [Anaerolineae bacterium]|nr:amino acid permease [Anaerolineae bacterium]